VIAHLALALLLPAALLTWRWSRLVSGALWFALATWLAYRGLRWAYPDAWAAGHLEPLRAVSAMTGIAGVLETNRWAAYDEPTARAPILGALLVASMGVDLTALLIHRGAGQWGPQPFFQVGVLLAMCAVSVWPRRKL